MVFNMDIDTGGTFTDGFVRGDGRFELIKVDTTPHDFTLCFLNCIEEAAKKFGLKSVDQFLARMNTLRLSTTIGTNALIQASGPKLGLLVTRGSEENAYAPKEAANPAFGLIIPKDMVIGIDEKIDENGISLSAPESSQVLEAVKNLLERGARRIVVCLSRSPLNPAHERKCREIILADYPAHYLGSVPLLLSTEVSNELDDWYRANAALVDAYIHQEMARYLYKADDDVRQRRYRWPLLITHATGGVARVAKTKAIDTCDSGPAAGLFGAAFISRLYGLKNVVTVDVGGTSTDIGLIANGEPCYTTEKTISNIPIKERVIESISIGGGGGSIASRDVNTGKLKVGPESVGAIPGPSCYGLGGNEATVTDAWVTLGYIDPQYFLGGRRRLDSTQARTVIKENIADPLQISIEKAAEAILENLNLNTAQTVKEFMRKKGIDGTEVTMFAFGGAGGLACANMARASGIPRVYFFPFGSAFCAFGSSCTDVLHNYRLSRKLILRNDDSESVIQEFNQAVKTMMDDAYFDMKGEGFEKEKVSLSLELVMTSGNSSLPVEVGWPHFFLNSQSDIPEILGLYEKATGANAVDHHIMIQELRLKASCHIPDPQFPEYPRVGEDPQTSLKATRAIFLEGQFQNAQVFEQGRLRCGNVIRGLAVIESSDTTILVPPGYKYTVDCYLNGVMEED